MVVPVLMAAGQLPPPLLAVVVAAVHQCFALLAAVFMPLVVGAAVVVGSILPKPAPVAAAAVAGAVSVIALYA